MKWIKWWYSPVLVITGALILFYAFYQPVTILLNNKPITVRTLGITVNDVLQSAGVDLRSGDMVSPAVNSWFLFDKSIQVRQLTYYSVDKNSAPIQLVSLETIPGNVLMDLGIRIFPGDRILVDGQNSSFDEMLEYQPQRTLQILSSPEVTPNQRHTNGQEMALIGLAPQGLDLMAGEKDFSNGSKSDVPERISDQLEISQKSLPYNSITQMDANLELDQSKVTQAGSYGVALQLNRTRYHNGTAGETRLESETIVKPAIDQVTGFGTKINVKTLDVGGTTIEYYRALSLYATSYSPCRSGTPECHSGTASGAPAAKGIVAVVSRWYPYMVGARVYIPGYGFAVVGDLGGGIPGTPWIDLGYSDDDFVSWHSYVMVYFLTPVPDNPLYILN